MHFLIGTYRRMFENWQTLCTFNKGTLTRYVSIFESGLQTQDLLGFSSAGVLVCGIFYYIKCAQLSHRVVYNVVNSIITNRKMYRCIFKVSFYFRESLYEINVLLTLFLQIEVSI